ncbi:MAG: hypothetical protein LBH76_01320 [Propionibacteriaceae bacterium]|nr:hypothetical protein [Propionibacteriaceae bacterium]
MVAALSGACPDVPRGSLTEVNDRSVAELSQVSVRGLRRRLKAAQQLVTGCEALTLEESLPYRRGYRRYTFAERLDITAVRRRA